MRNRDGASAGFAFVPIHTRAKEIPPRIMTPTIVRKIPFSRKLELRPFPKAPTHTRESLNTIRRTR